ncbi:putative protein OS=Streptomyces aurantiogriseus OX=66870 GN=GCM10010251_93610 PE=4 SV=1 [Streptomyces aurantiogriseus]|uniref:Uncharacterized protein n=1 Tax=Streptomyces aurantiogriseus TaxID=66870 RepID=A0A918FNZ9_9ACTN|nr:hypothetical protein GCM10010251_93610 [Streptomyces aurantiogriseus]
MKRLDSAYEPSAKGWFEVSGGYVPRLRARRTEFDHMVRPDGSRPRPPLGATVQPTVQPSVGATLSLNRAGCGRRGAGQAGSHRQPAYASASTARERTREAFLGLGWDVLPSETNFLWLPTGDASGSVAQEGERRGLPVRAFPGSGLRVTVGSPEANDLLTRGGRGDRTTGPVTHRERGPRRCHAGPMTFLRMWPKTTDVRTSASSGRFVSLSRTTACR